MYCMIHTHLEYEQSKFNGTSSLQVCPRQHSIENKNGEFDNKYKTEIVLSQM